ncbi:hypothetical protein LOB26_10900, partial [Lactobacillus delbrueckii subsp. lactis]|nr:hypothetical protein [Lactobacillus delbrueckii subsp. lactis]
HIHYSFHVALLSCMLAVIELAAQMAFFQAADAALKTANAVSKLPLSLGRMLDGQLCLQSRQLMSQLFGCLNVLVAVGIAPIYPFSLGIHELAEIEAVLMTAAARQKRCQPFVHADFLLFAFVQIMDSSLDSAMDFQTLLIPVEDQLDIAALFLVGIAEWPRQLELLSFA